MPATRVLVGYARVEVSAPLVVSLFINGTGGPMEPLSPLPADAELISVALVPKSNGLDVLVLTFESETWPEKLRDAKILPVSYRMGQAVPKPKP